MKDPIEIIHQTIIDVREAKDVDMARLIGIGEINMAKKLGLIGEPERAELTLDLLLACQKRRAELHAARMDALRYAEAGK